MAMATVYAAGSACCFVSASQSAACVVLPKGSCTSRCSSNSSIECFNAQNHLVLTASGCQQSRRMANHQSHRVSANANGMACVSMVGRGLRVSKAKSCFLSSPLAHKQGQEHHSHECYGVRIGSGACRRGMVYCEATASAVDNTTRIPQVEQVCGVCSARGTGRPTMEDTYAISVDTTGARPSFFGVYDGHGGAAVAGYLQNSFWGMYERILSEVGSEDMLADRTRQAYLEADKETIAPQKGFFGAFKERGIGGSRCGATAATAVLLSTPDGQQKLVAANVGDARVVLARGAQALQLTIDHTPDLEPERKRIEKKNPTPKKPLVVNVDGTWRIGGLLALSRSFGDVYLKNWSDGKDASGGFGLICEPHVTIETITSVDKFLIMASDGLWEFLSNQQVVDRCLSRSQKETPTQLAQILTQMAQAAGSTDDITVIVVQLPGASVGL
eukprot:TRINITY_DN1299_c0_g1_i1.p1 TRINITY_DN1299_c0_g1~~TRINITY_DN1299_c0_g1_i1.p1  ORF type:complete len:444 (-),score=73.03 TRINITY_DN1299_c0_g1_i1:409-1740(-)